MQGMVPTDPQTRVSQAHFAVVYLPNAGANNKKRKSKRSNKRFPAGCVEIKADKDAAVQAAQLSEKKFAAVVIGPSKSSEGQFIYYLQEWL